MKENHNTSIIHYDITVIGRVQHVGFRYSAENMAAKFGVFGIVRNTPEGTVYLEIEGSKIATDLMIEWCKIGPGTARVDELLCYESTIKGYSSFNVTY